MLCRTLIYTASHMDTSSSYTAGTERVVLHTVDETSLAVTLCASAITVHMLFAVICPLVICPYLYG